MNSSPKPHLLSSLVYLTVTCVALSSASSADATAGCIDSNEHCNYWSSTGECAANPGYMHLSCKLSCNTCSADDIAITVRRAIDGTGNNGEQNLSGVWWADPTSRDDYMDDIKSYMRDEVWNQARSSGYMKTRSACVNKDDMCSHWAMQGRCTEVDVKLSCGPSCESCDFLDEEVRCGVIDQVPNALVAGSLDAIFNRIVNNFSSAVTVHSRPVVKDTDEPDDGSLEEEGRKKQLPWIVTIDNFISDEEIDRILQYGEQTGYEKSGEVFDGNHYDSKKTQQRTSENSWCGFQFGDTCFADPIVKGLLNRVAHTTTIPTQNYGEMQILRYQPGQYYNTHGDYIKADNDRHVGGRILTFFLYFNDVTEGGETEFPRLNPPVKITPKKGTALLWANVLDEDPHVEDYRMWHQGLPVVQGVKHAANLWIHMRDVRTPTEMKCRM